jgi:hypothetical protein
MQFNEYQLNLQEINRLYFPFRSTFAMSQVEIASD